MKKRLICCVAMFVLSGVLLGTVYVPRLSGASVKAAVEVEPVVENPVPVQQTVQVSETALVSQPAVSSDPQVTDSDSSVPAVPVPRKSPKTTGSKKAVTAPAKPGSSKVTVPFAGNGANNTDIDHNVFMDAMAYTGYNFQKQRSDGNMWKYIFCSQKRGLGYLSPLSYSGSSSGYEVKNGKPDIQRMARQGGLVCASYVTYVYFNYLPNVAGIDTSSLARPARSTSANDWYIAAKSWLSKGQASAIPFSASIAASKYTTFKCNYQIPIGSLLIFGDAKTKGTNCTHVSIYAGYKNNYHWLFHVGNANGPELCAIERMAFGADPQRLMMIISTPTKIRTTAALTVTLKDDANAPIAGMTVKARNSTTGIEYTLGKTNAKGQVYYENMPYGSYTLTHTVPGTHTAKSSATTVQLTAKNNSANAVTLTALRKKGGVTLKVCDLNHQPVAGAVFAVYNTSGQEVLRLAATDAAGTAKSSAAALSYGSYTLKQVQAAAGFESIKQDIAFTLNAGQVSLTAVNEPILPVEPDPNPSEVEEVQ